LPPRSAPNARAADCDRAYRSRVNATPRKRQEPSLDTGTQFRWCARSLPASFYGSVAGCFDPVPECQYV
jgi:hypothetical protein